MKVIEERVGKLEVRVEQTRTEVIIKVSQEAKEDEVSMPVENDRLCRRLSKCKQNKSTDQRGKRIY